jgi:hypothetical protein
LLGIIARIPNIPQDALQEQRVMKAELQQELAEQD